MSLELKYILILLCTFAVSHFFFTLLEKAEYLPEWMNNPLRASLIVTGIVQLWLTLRWLQNSMPTDVP